MRHQIVFASFGALCLALLAMAAMPELQSPGRTSWRPSDVAACLRLALWDPDRNRMIGWDELPTNPTP